LCTETYRDEDEPETIEDTNAEKPEGWLDDEPELVPDNNAEEPEDWSVHLHTVYEMLYFSFAKYVVVIWMTFSVNSSTNLLLLLLLLHYIRFTALWTLSGITRVSCYQNQSGFY